MTSSRVEAFLSGGFPDRPRTALDSDAQERHGIIYLYVEIDNYSIMIYPFLPPARNPFNLLGAIHSASPDQC